MYFLPWRIWLAVGAVLWLAGLEVLAQKQVYSHGEPTDFEQLMLELVNEARADPVAEAEALGIDLNQGLAAGRISRDAKPPLAFHPLLIEAARGHSDWMLAEGVFSHTGSGGSSPTQRAAALGYPFQVVENIAYRSTTGVLDFEESVYDNHDGLFKSPGHRVNLMNPAYSVVGLGVRRGSYRDANAQMVSQGFSEGGNSTDSGPFLLGVVFDDKNGNGVYDPGEGVPGVRVEPDFGGYYAVTSASGGYAVPLPPERTVSEDAALPFAVVSNSWEQARPYDEAFRSRKIAEAPEMALRIDWSGEGIGGNFRSYESVKRPVRIDYRLMGTNNSFFPRTMVAAENVKVDFLLQDPPGALLERVVRFSGNLGEFDLELFGDRAPHTVRNFLNYVESGRYDGTFIHRSVPGFVVQGGGFGLNGTAIAPVETDAAVVNEPGISNTRGTVAMAKLGGDPDSATSQWFINLADNSGILDQQNGGFTVFGRVVGNGMAVADRVAGLQRRDLRAQLGGAFEELPLLGPNATVANLVRFQRVRALGGGTLVREFDFSSGDAGFVAGFADYPADGDVALYELMEDHRSLPAELGGGQGLFISGHNRSDDLWMFWKRKITGLRPDTVYEVAMDVEMASNVPAGLAGIGGVPGESVYVKAGASTGEPVVVRDSGGWSRMNVDKGNQSNGGAAASVLGTVAKENDASEAYARLFRDNRSGKISARSSRDGSLWVFFGTDSGFEGKTSLYYTRLAVTLEPKSALPPQITSSSLANGKVGVPFNYQITALNFPESFAATGLPSGWTLNATTGWISGTPMAVGNFSLGLTATNAGGTGNLVLEISIGKAVEDSGSSFGAVEDGGESPVVVKSKKKGGKGKTQMSQKSGGSKKKSEAKKSGGKKKSEGKKSGGKKKKRR